MFFKEGKQPKIFVKENREVSFTSEDNADTFYCNLADSLLQKLPCPESKFGMKTPEEYCNQIRNKRNILFCTMQL